MWSWVKDNDMTAQTSFNFNFPPNPYKPQTGNWRVYEHLRQYGKVTLHELHHVLWVDTARIRTDVKPYLRKHGYDVACLKIRDGLTEYIVQTL